ncbi:MAG TPA: NADP-dependent oxidoreductase [Novosphingobium sp.]|nr:NADP-dependent oxidoreductase [Novosphingobium sp.]
MRAIVMTAYGDADVLRLAVLPVPAPGPGEVLVRVRAAAVNPADGKWRAGLFAAMAPLSLPHVLGYDIAGEVVAGDGFAVGAQVFGMLDPFRKGGYAEYAVARAADLALMPPGMAAATAAAIPTAGLTGRQMAAALALRPGQQVLVTGAVGAVGRFALHATRAAGAQVVAAVRPGQQAAALAAGAASAAPLEGGEWQEKDWQGAPFDHVLDTVGGAAVGRWCRHLRPGGRILSAATTPIAGEHLPAVPEFFTVAPSAGDLAALGRAVAAGEVAVPVACCLPLAAAATAQRQVEAGGLAGKIVLLP